MNKMIRRLIIGSAVAAASVTLLPVVTHTLRPLIKKGVRCGISAMETIKEEAEDIIAEAKLERMQQDMEKELIENDEELDEGGGKSSTFSFIPAAKDTFLPIVESGVKSVKTTIGTIKEEIEDLIVEAKMERSKQGADSELFNEINSQEFSDELETTLEKEINTKE